MNARRWAGALGAALMGLCVVDAALAQQGAVITFGNTSLGVNATGELNFDGLGPDGRAHYGVYRAGVGDAISPGCACEGWGLALTTAGGGAASVS